jgi:hypothetical protein
LASADQCGSMIDLLATVAAIGFVVWVIGV